MPTRADFYVGDGPGAEWLGSCSFDGQPAELDKAVLKAASQDEYREAVLRNLMERPDGILPEDGWPWAWDDSYITDYVYSWRHGALWGRSTGEWFLIDRFSATFGETDDGIRGSVKGGSPDFPCMEQHRKHHSRRSPAQMKE